MLSGRKTDCKKVVTYRQTAKRKDRLQGLLGKQTDFQTGRQTVRHRDILSSWQKDFHAGRQTVKAADRL